MRYLILIIFLSSCGGGNSNSSSGLNNPPGNPVGASQDGSPFDYNITIGNRAKAVFFLVDFTNRKIQSSSQTWSNKIFGTDNGQLNDYYAEVSNNNFQLEPAINNSPNESVIKVTYDDVMPNIDVNNINESQLYNILRSVLTAVSSTTNNPNLINFADFDSNGNGAISRDELQLIFILAGNEQAIGDSNGVVWAHASSLDNFTLNGVRLMQYHDGGGYAVFGESHKMNTDATIGIIAHELGHSLFNLPDLYDVSESSAGIGNFGLMGSGSWGQQNGQNPGESPVHPTAYSKIESGFITPTVLAINNSSISVRASSDNNFNTYKVFISNPKEYFLIANRHNSGYDRGLHILTPMSEFTGGILITHINENQKSNSDKDNKLVDVEEANDAELDIKDYISGRLNQGHINNLFFANNQSDFNETTIPNTSSDSENVTGIDISNISGVGNIMTFDLNL